MADACECGNEPSGSVKWGNFLTSYKPVSCSGRTLHHAVSKINFLTLTWCCGSILPRHQVNVTSARNSVAH